MRRGWSCRRGQEAAAVFLFGKSGDGACGACQTEKIWYNGRRIMPRRCAAKGDAMRIFVAGAGAWGTALAMLLEENGHAVTLWTRNAEKAREIDITRQNPALAGVTLPAGIRVTAELAEAEDAELVLGYKPGKTDVTSGDLELAGYKSIFEQMVADYNFEYCISSLRVSHSASDNGWSACIYSRDTKEFYHSKEYSIHPIVDRVGGGDSFAGGVICGMLDGKNFKDALEFGVAASALKHTIPGDFNLVSRKEVETLAGGDASGRVQR